MDESMVTKFGVFRDQAAMHIVVGVHLHVRTFTCATFPYLGNGWTDCAEIWCVVRDPPAAVAAEGIFQWGKEANQFARAPESVGPP